MSGAAPVQPAVPAPGVAPVEPAVVAHGGVPVQPPGPGVAPVQPAVPGVAPVQPAIPGVAPVQPAVPGALPVAPGYPIPGKQVITTDREDDEDRSYLSNNTHDQVFIFVTKVILFILIYTILNIY